MKTRLFTSLAVGAVITMGALAGCKKSDGPNGGLEPSGPDNQPRKYITLTGAFPDDKGTAGNGGTMAFAITPEEAINPNFEVNVYSSGYPLRSQRTARVQGSTNGNFLYNIQYTGTDGGIFNKYRVDGGKVFTDTREEMNTEPILGTAPRWVVAAEGVGIGVYASATIKASAEGAGADFVDVTSTAKIAIMDLNDPQVTRQTEFTIPFTAEQTKAGYQIGRIDVPIVNATKTKVFIGCNLTRTDVTKKSGIKDNVQTWSTGNRELGTVTLVVDYPSLANPKLIYADAVVSKVNNHSYRTMTQYVGTDGNVYQATATSGSQILRINKSTNQYDNDYNFDLKTALGTSNSVAIRAWKYIKDGVAIVLYTESKVDGGYLALVDLNERKATRLTTENQSDIGFSGRSANEAQGITAITGTFGQFQNIGVIGDNIYVPMTPNGVDGNLYVINYKTKAVTKGARLKNQSGSFYIGAY
ncbi:hypothetical protein [Sphingobacterium yanglingense]|uniref:DUF4374 domain-containing protein n=1 Tax=Sphingobacterium yanglingense TaxID=1437280 RepID=A0A4V3DDE4_9SPHI|nr:hypothetical protein [Sphingobacterium yanglingense]TDQ75960.1 hypothetical protein CLV99_3656 [Sphingobacterium yanglingense]